ncbi:MAG TPA: hypothetical protein DD435_08560 [Cyanobacteria bacterium UBA8530]|nr:hypothetical protein [Cyanobacteria bacterium UBA8530]
MKERGFALVAALMIGMVLILVGIGASTYIMSQGRLVTQLNGREEALNIADAGLEWAISRYPSAVATKAPFNKGEYEISTPASVGGGRYVIRVDSYLPSKSNFAHHRAIQAVIDSVSTTHDPIFDKAIASGGNTTLNGNMTVTSSPAPNQGHVHANGNLLSHGNVHVYGNTTAHGTDAYGGHSNTAAVEIPTLDAAKIDSLYQEAAALASHTFAEFDGSTLSGYYAPASTWAATTESHSNFNINGNLNVPLDKIVFIDGDLTVNGNCTITGGGTIVVNGTVNINGNAKLGQGTELSIISLSSDAQALTLNGNLNIGGPSTTATPPPGTPNPSIIIFAPNGGARINGNADIFGSVVVGGNALVNGNAKVTRVSNRSNGVLGVPSASSWRVFNWREVSP